MKSIHRSNRNRATDFMFSRKFWFLDSIPGGADARYAPPLRTPMTAVAILSEKYMPMCSQRYVWPPTRSELITSLQINHRGIESKIIQ